MGAGADKVVAPDVILMLRPQPHARTVVQPQAGLVASVSAALSALPAARSAALGPCPHPSPLAQHRRDPPIAVASILAGQLQDGSRQPIFVVALDRDVSLRPSPLPQQPARMPLRQPMLLPSMLYRATSPFRA